MWFLFFEIWIWLVFSFIFGWFSHWFFCCRGKSEEHEEATQAEVELPSEASFGEIESEQINVSDDWKPMLFNTAPTRTDDLKQIKGVGEVLEKTLHDLGVYEFQQIADWTDEHVAWMNNFLSFTGRIDREKWREQAKIFSRGEETEFAQQLKKDDVKY